MAKSKQKKTRAGADDRSSGLGLAICTRLIETFLTTRPATQRLHLLPTTRSRAKADATVAAHEGVVADHAAGRRPPPPAELVGPARADGAARGGDGRRRRGAGARGGRALYAGRVTLDPVLLDLLSLASVRAAAAALVHPPASSAASRLGESWAALPRPRVPRLDVLVCNAGVGGWLGVDWWGCAVQVWREGVAAAVGRPEYKICDVGAVAGPQLPGGGKQGEEPPLAKVFCANLFGHYVFARALAPLLGGGAGREPARVVWVSTLEAYARWFDEGDVQGLRSNNAYESSKRLTDLLSLTARDERSAPWVARWLSPGPSLPSSTGPGRPGTPTTRAKARAKAQTAPAERCRTGPRRACTSRTQASA